MPAPRRHAVVFSLEESPWHAALVRHYQAAGSAGGAGTVERLSPRTAGAPLLLRALSLATRTAGRLGGLSSLGSSTRPLVSALGQRRMLGHWAAAALPASPRSGFTVVAPSLAAREVFARAAARGLPKALFLDVPHLLSLHAALEHPAIDQAPADAAQDAGLRDLRDFRAPAWALTRQLAELELADEILVRGEHAAAMVAARLRPQQRLVLLAAAPTEAAEPAEAGSPRRAFDAVDELLARLRARIEP